MSLERKLLLAFTGMAVLLAVAIAVTYHNHQQLRLMHGSLGQAHEADKQLQRILHLVTDAETGARGFVLSGSDEFLEPYLEAEAAIPAEVEKLRTLLARTEVRAAQLQDLEAAIAEKLRWNRSTVDEARAAGLDAARRRIVSGRGRALMDEVRNKSEIIRAEQEAHLTKRRMESDARDAAATTISAALVAIMVGTLCVAYLLVRFHLAERRTAEAERDRFFTLSLDMMCVSNPGGFFKRVNPAFTQTLGWSEDELLDRPIVDFVVPEDRSATIEVCQSLSKDGGVVSFENRYLCKDGEVRILSWKSAQQPDGCIYATARDITARKRAEEALQASEEYSRSIVESSDDCLMVLGTDGHVLDVPHGTHRSRSAHRDFRGADWQSFWPDAAAQPAERAIELARGGKTGRFRGFSSELSDSPKWWDVTVTPIRGPRGDVERLLSVARDATEQRKGEQAIEDARLNADRANHAKSEFLSRMSHELRTPMNAILGFAQVIEMANPPEAYKVPIEHIMKAGRHLLELINEVLDIAKIEAGRMTISLEPVPLAEVVAECVALIRPLAAQRQVYIESSLAPDDTSHVLADRQRLKQALLNLLSNGVKFNKADGKISVYAEASTNPPRNGSEGERKIRLYIADTGLGIPRNELPRLFEPFERLDADSRGIEGTGLGLALTKRLLTLMGAAIDVESEQNQGTTFSIDLRAASAPVAPRLTVQPKPESTAFIGRRSILYIEDNLSNYQLIEHILGSYSEVKLLAAMQGALGLDLAREHRPDLILLDLHLPDMMGDEVLRRLRADEATKQIPVIILTADATPTQESRLLSAGANAYHTKPFDVARLLHSIEGILENPKNGTSKPI